MSGQRGPQDFGLRCCFGSSVPVSHEVSTWSIAWAPMFALSRPDGLPIGFCHAVTVLDSIAGCDVIPDGCCSMLDPSKDRLEATARRGSQLVGTSFLRLVESLRPEPKYT